MQLFSVRKMKQSGCEGADGGVHRRDFTGMLLPPSYRGSFSFAGFDSSLLPMAYQPGIDTQGQQSCSMAAIAVKRDNISA